MTSLLVKITKDGVSQKFIFNKLGPIIIGSDEKCDVHIDGIDQKALEIKLSAGNLAIRSLGSKEKLFLDQAVLSTSSEVPYESGNLITLSESLYQVQIFKSKEATEPPPFFSDEYQKTLNELRWKIKSKEEALLSTERLLEKRRTNLETLESQIRGKLAERNKREQEIQILSQRSSLVYDEIDKTQVSLKKKEQDLRYSEKTIEKLRDENHQLNLLIQANETNLLRIKIDIEKHHNELKSAKERISLLQLEEKKNQIVLSEIKSESEEYARQTISEQQKVQQILKQSDTALKKKQDIQIKIEKFRRNHDSISEQLADLQIKLEAQEKCKNESEIKLQELGCEIENQENTIIKLRQNILYQQEQERQLLRLNEDLKLELIKVEDKISIKKDQYQQIEHQVHDAQKILNQHKHDIDARLLHLTELNMEEKSQDLKMVGLRREYDFILKKLNQEKKVVIEEFEQTKVDQLKELQEIADSLTEHKAQISELKHAYTEGQKKHQDLFQNNKNLQSEKSNIESQIKALTYQKSCLDKSNKILLEENSGLGLEKNKLVNDISLLRLKLLDCEGQIKQKEAEAMTEIDNLKKQELRRIEAERHIMLDQIQLERQKGQREVDEFLKSQQDKIHQLSMDQQKESKALLHNSQREASVIVKEALQTEKNLTEQASKRLHEATIEAYEREKKSNNRMEEAQIFYEKCEDEAHSILSQAKSHAFEIKVEAEKALMADLDLRKMKIRDYINNKHKKVEKHLQHMELTSREKIKKEHELILSNFEKLKKKELKKVARIKSESLSEALILRDQMLLQVKEERKKALEDIYSFKNHQELEFAEAKKSFLEQLSNTKMRQSQQIESDIKKRLDDFERTKTQRMHNASKAIHNILLTELGVTDEGHPSLQEKIDNALQGTLNGFKIENQELAEQILDFNPSKSKSLLPVLQKYSVRYALPTVIAFVLLADTGSLRTKLTEFSLDIIKQNNPASDIFVKNRRKEWKEKYTFNPITTPSYKDTYTENILYTTDFYKVMEDENFQNRWILAINDFIVRDLELSEDIAINFISSEGNLVKEMWQIRSEIHPQFIDSSIKKLKDLEQTQIGWISSKINSDEKLKKLYYFRKSFYEKFYKNQPAPFRGLANQEEPEL